MMGSQLLVQVRQFGRVMLIFFFAVILVITTALNADALPSVPVINEDALAGEEDELPDRDGFPETEVLDGETEDSDGAGGRDLATPQADNQTREESNATTAESVPDLNSLEDAVSRGMSALQMMGNSYLEWEVLFEGEPVPGASVEVGGPYWKDPRTGNGVWISSAVVSDCTSAPCAPDSIDQDPQPGKFRIYEINAGGAATAMPEIRSQNVYRIRPADNGAPAGYTWVDGGRPWQQIPGEDRAPEDAWPTTQQGYKFPDPLELIESSSVMWQVEDQENRPVGGAMVTLEGPDENAAGGVRAVRVTDCTQAPCAPISMDQDPAPGIFRVHTLRWGTSEGFATTPVINTGRYEVTPYDSPVGYGWDESNSSLVVSDGWKVNTRHDLGSFSLTESATLEWEVTDEDSVPVGGATIEVQEYSDDIDDWGSVFHVTDCTVGPCHPTSSDRDPEPGKFQLDTLYGLEDHEPTAQDINPGQRYRILPTGSIPGYAWTVGQDSIEIQGNAEEDRDGDSRIIPALQVTGGRLPSQLCVAEENQHSYYALGQDTTNSISLQQHSHNSGETAINEEFDLLTGSPFPGLSVAGQSADALGVTRTGIFYFTGQNPTVDNDKRRNITIYRFDSEYDDAPYAVFNMDLLSPTTGIVVAGDATMYQGQEEYYFAYYSGSPVYINGKEALRFHLYRYSHGNGDRTGEVKHVDVERPDTFQGEMTGDFAFDAQNNIQYLISDPTGNTVSGVILAKDFQQQLSAHSLPEVSQILGQRGQFGKVATGINGVAYTMGGHAIIQGVLDSKNRHRFVALPTLNFQGNEPREFPGTPLVDLAGCFTPTTITVQKDLRGERIDSDDQFILNAERTVDGAASGFASATTTGDRTGIQREQVGPFAITLDGEFSAWEEYVGDDEAGYTTTWSCHARGLGSSLREAFVSGEGTELTFNLAEVESGAELVCIFANTPLVAQLKVEKTSDPVSHTPLDEGAVVNYTLTFDNSAGTLPAEVDHLDHLYDILDDAFFVNSDGQPSPVDEPDISVSVDVPDLKTSWAVTNLHIKVEGTIPVGEVVEVTYSVRIRPHAETRAGNNPWAYQLTNFLTRSGDDVPEFCHPGLEAQKLCTTNPISAWTLQMAADPADGEEVNGGDTIRYRLIAEKKTPNTAINGLVFTDNLSEVLAAAGFVQEEPSNGIYFFDGSGATLEVPVGANAESAPNGGTPEEPTRGAGIPAPNKDGDGWTLTNDPINVPRNAERAELWFSVKVADNSGPPPLAGTSFTNYVKAEATSLPPAQCVADQQCQATHTIRTVASIVLPLTGGRSLMLLTVTGGMLLAIAGGGIIWWRRQQQSGSAD